MKMTFSEFKDDWLEKHNASIPVEESYISPYPVWARTLCLLAFATSALASGVHTMTVVYEGIPLSPMVDEIQRRWVARGAFISYELGMYLAAFLMAVKATRGYARLMAFVIFATLISVNLYSVYQVYGFNFLTDPAGAFVTGFFALVPIIAYGSGKLYVNIGAAEAEGKRKSREAVRTQWQELDTIILRDFKKYEKEYKAEHTDHTQYVPSTEEYKRKNTEIVPPKAVRTLADLLKANEADISLSAADIRAKYGGGQSTANDAKKLAARELGEQRKFTNGHDTETPLQ